MERGALRVSFDSNVWEKIVSSHHRGCEVVRCAITQKGVQAFICEAAFRIEAVPKKHRPAYFSAPLSDVQVPGDITVIEGKPCIRILSFGPDDSRHPGLPEVQALRLRSAISMGVRLMRGLAWMGLPSPKEILDPTIFAKEGDVERTKREQRQIEANAEIWKRGVGKAVFDAAGGWKAFHAGQTSEKKAARACAEWADGELAAAHVAYGNDVLLTFP